MMVSIPHVLSGISILLLAIYGADVAVGGGQAGEGFLPLDGMTRGIGFGMPPIILSFIAFFIAKKPPFIGLGIMLTITGALIIIGSIYTLLTLMTESSSAARVAGEGAGLIVVGAVIVVLGMLKIRKSTKMQKEQ